MVSKEYRKMCLDNLRDFNVIPEEVYKKALKGDNIYPAYIQSDYQLQIWTEKKIKSKLNRDSAIELIEKKASASSRKRVSLAAFARPNR